jgi:hypothetical protein
MIEFQAWPKTPRLFRDMVISEKIDGTNAAVQILDISDDVPPPDPEADNLGFGQTEKSKWVSGFDSPDGRSYLVAAQSRKRLITPEDDNFGFAKWVFDNAGDLVRLLGPGRHFGEWWGSGIQRGYGLTKGEKRFSLFNVSRYGPMFETLKSAGMQITNGLGVVPVLYEGPFGTAAATSVLNALKMHGSQAAPGFMQPEGIVVYHTAANQTFKVTVEGDDKPKGSAG